jgi:hypothetical protein
VDREAAPPTLSALNVAAAAPDVRRLATRKGYNVVWAVWPCKRSYMRGLVEGEEWWWRYGTEGS